VNRREFITLLGGAAVAWPLAARAQQSERVRRIGVLMPLTADDADEQTLMPIFVQGVQQLGWTEGRNLRIDFRGAGANPDDSRKYAAELVALAPDVILSIGGVNLPSLLQVTRTIPIVFLRVPDPVAAGFVDSLARPGGNVTGFASIDYSVSTKWLELLKEIAPRVTRAAVVRDATLAAGTGQLGAIQAMASSAGIAVTPINVRDASEMERALIAFAAAPNGGLIVTGSALARSHRDLIAALALRLRLPAVSYHRAFVTAGGLISYGIDQTDQYRRAAGYVGRILKGEKPADLPVQQPTKFELVINLKTAKALGLEIPPMLLARADEVIE
jgi:putative tryptophan/tyrosine transport system substrate-binding protein